MTKKEITAQVAVECVPWQKCPICEGYKQVWRRHPEIPMGTDAVQWEICNTCNGLGIIPMYIVPLDRCSTCGQSKVMSGDGILRQLCICPKQLL